MEAKKLQIKMTNWKISEKPINIGYSGENLVCEFEVLFNTDPGAYYYLQLDGWLSAPNNILFTTVTDDGIKVNLTTEMLGKSGKKKAQIVEYLSLNDNTPIKKSNIFNVIVEDSINATQDVEPHYQTALEQWTAELDKFWGDINEALAGKQDTLIAGENITIDGNVISATGGGASDYEDLSHKPQINNVELVGNKTLAQLGAQPTLTAGSNIAINNNVISATGLVPTTRKIAQLPLSEDITATQLSDKVATLAKTWQNLMTNNSGIAYLYTDIYSKIQVDGLLAGKENVPLATVEETPSNVYANVGDVVELRVISYTTRTLYYQWQVSTNGTSWSDVTGATSSTYQYTVVAGDDGKQFRCRVSTDAAPNVATGGYYMIKIADYPVENVTVNGSSVVNNGVAQITIPSAPTSDQLVPSHSSTDSGKVLGVNAQGEAEWKTESVTDVQIDSTSILNNGTANIPIATPHVSAQQPGSLGVMKAKRDSGTDVNASGELIINPATPENIRQATQGRKPIVPTHQHEAAFYGLARASGDTTQANADTTLYPVGTYTDDAKEAIQQMIGILSSQGVGF